MDLFNKLPEKDREMMLDYIDAFASKRGNQRSASLEYIMRVWNENKQNLYHLFGDNFIISKPVSFTRSTDQLENDLSSDKFWTESNEFRRSFSHWLLSGVVDLYSKEYYDLESLLESDTLANNTYTGETFSIKVPDSDYPIKINKGAHATKILGKIAKAFNLDGFEDFRISHSMVLNQKKLDGNMCLSIHPLDYMTMSDNASDWTSCMSWQEEGCYRQGTVEMMNSPCVVVAYLTAASDMKMPIGKTWNNKKWRQLFIVKPELIANVKAYPYRNDELTKFVLSWLKELAEKAGIGHYTNNIVKYNAYQDFNIEELDNRPVQIEPRTHYMYNDFAKNQFAYFGETIPAGTFEFYYSGDPECMGCGAISCDFVDESYLMGTCCEVSFQCDYCGDYVDSEDELYEVDGQMLCQYCYEDYCAEDSFEKEVHLGDDNLRPVYISFDGGKTVHTTELTYHPEPYIMNPSARYKDIMGDDFIHLYKGRSTDEWSIDILYFNAEDVTDEGLALMGYNSLDELDYYDGSDPTVMNKNSVEQIY